mmetsp:Transcript_61298/g.72793  ORF Transcript_61298/g.72793 Transcript_61298/m.72793 type:complete len:201 (-) Transcript_61298:457-1059(-)
MQLALIPHLLLLLLRIREQLPNLLLTTPHKLIQNLRPVHNLRIPRVQNLTNLTRNQRLTAPGGTVKQHTPHVINTHLFNNMTRPYPRRERATKNLVEFLVQTANAKFFKVKVFQEDGGHAPAPAARYAIARERHEGTALFFTKQDFRGGDEFSHVLVLVAAAALALAFLLFTTATATALQINPSRARYLQFQLNPLKIHC